MGSQVCLQKNIVIGGLHLNFSQEENELVNDAFSYFGLTNSATKEDVHKAYLKLVKRYHPDMFQDEAAKELAEEKIKKANNVNDVLNLYFNLCESENESKQSADRNFSASKEHTEQMDADELEKLIIEACSFFGLTQSCTKDDVYAAYLDLLNAYQDDIANANFRNEYEKAYAEKLLQKAKNYKDFLYKLLDSFEKQRDSNQTSSTRPSNSGDLSFEKLRNEVNAEELQEYIKSSFAILVLTMPREMTHARLQVHLAHKKLVAQYDPKKYQDPDDIKFAERQCNLFTKIRDFLYEYIDFCEKEKMSKQSSSNQQTKTQTSTTYTNKKGNSNYYYSYCQEEKEKSAPRNNSYSRTSSSAAVKEESEESSGGSWVFGLIGLIICIFFPMFIIAIAVYYFIFKVISNIDK